MNDQLSGLGELKGEYRPRSAKLVFNVIITAILLFLGWMLVDMLRGFYNSPGAAVVVGLIFAAGGAAYIVVPILRRRGKRARLYEEGVSIKTRGKSQSWRFDEIDGVSVTSGQNRQLASAVGSGISSAIPGANLVARFVVGAASGALQAAVPADVNNYRFYIAKKRIFDIGPLYKDWKDLGAAVYLEVSRRLVGNALARVEAGEAAVFDGLPGGMIGTRTITVTRTSIQQDDKAPLPWSEVKSMSGDREGYAIIEGKERGSNVRFGVGNALNGLIALQVVSTVYRKVQDGEL